MTFRLQQLVSFFLCLLIKTSFAITSRDSDDSGDLDDDFSEFTFTKGAAIGDSYAAGLGAGTEISGLEGCARYDGSYANLVGTSFEGIDFTYSPCSGALIKGATKQASALSSDQEFIIISAGGNDAQLTEILNGCVYRFWGQAEGDHNLLWSAPDCDEKLDEVNSALENGDFDEKLDELIEVAQSKLTEDGNIYYVGYAKFFDTSDAACDDVSWHFWNSFGVETALSQDRRRSMNRVVDAMNDVLSLAVNRAGPRVHFVDYDKYVDITNGRFCAPGVDESQGNGADRPELFFYQMKTEEGSPPIPDNLENAKRDEDVVAPANGTLGAVYDAWIETTLEESDTKLEVNADIANDEIIKKVKERQEDIIHFGPGAKFVSLSSNETSSASGTAMPSSAAAIPKFRIVTEEDQKKGSSTPDSVARIFHPTRGGHEIIANLILYKMEAIHAGDTYPAEVVNSIGGDLPHVESLSCEGESSPTWADRDTMISNIYDFCSDPQNLEGSKGDLTSDAFNFGSLDYLNISISWDTDGSIGEHACRAWLDAITDGCDVPNENGDKAGNLKHGGTVAYQNFNANATFKITPLSVRRLWNGGVTRDCAVDDNFHVTKQPLRQQEVAWYCDESVAHKQDLDSANSGIAGSGDVFSKKLDIAPINGAMEVKTQWPPGEQTYQVFREECLYFINKLLNECQDPEPDFSNFNFQSTGTISAMSGVNYTISFLPGKQPDKIPTNIFQQPMRVVNTTSNATQHDNSSVRLLKLGNSTRG